MSIHFEYGSIYDSQRFGFGNYSVRYIITSKQITCCKYNGTVGHRVEIRHRVGPIYLLVLGPVVILLTDGWDRIVFGHHSTRVIRVNRKIVYHLVTFVVYCLPIYGTVGGIAYGLSACPFVRIFL